MLSAEDRDKNQKNHDEHDHHDHEHSHEGHDHDHGDDCPCEVTAKRKFWQPRRTGCGCGHDDHSGDDHSHGHNHSHDHGDEEGIEPISLIIGIVFFIAGILLTWQDGLLPGFVTIGVFVIAYLCIGKDVLLNAAHNMRNGRVFDENFLMSIASLGAFAIGEYPEAVAVMLFYQVGEFMQGKAVARSRKSIRALMDIRPDTANLLTEKGIIEVAAESVQVEDIIVIKAGGKVPLDGIVTEGISTVDNKALTGESLPVDVAPGANVLSGSINGSGLLHLQVTKNFNESTASKILKLVENASNKKAKAENFITKFARYYTPAVVLIAVLLAVVPSLVLQMGSFSEWLYRALVFLVISCPCALVISIPLGFFGGIGAASSKGILVKGSNYLEALNGVDTVVFDKTGTLTTGHFRVTEVLNAAGFTRDEVLTLGAYAENHSTHPIAVSIKEMYREENGQGIDEEKLSDIVEVPGKGIKVQMEGRTVLAGNRKLMAEEGISFTEDDKVGTVVYMAVDGQYAGAIVIADEVKKDSKETIADLHNLGIKQMIMLTGDNREIGHKIGNDLGLDDVYAELLPHQKVEILEKIMVEQEAKGEEKNRGKVIFVGDGINDAPSLARADIGFAMGGVGSDAAIEAADVVIMNDEPSKIITALKIAKKTRRIVWQNIALAMGVKGFVLLLGAFGIATMWEAVFADVGVALLAVLNAVRAGRIQ